jgi:hypothetical protein
MLSASAPVLDGPTSTTDETPTLSWTGEDGAEDFEMDVYSVSLGRRVVHLPKTSATSFTFTDPLAAGTSYQVYVRDVTGGCLSPWSVHTITIEAPRVPVVIVPMTTYDTTPTIAWTAEENRQFNVQIYDLRIGRLVFDSQGIVDKSVTVPSRLERSSYTVFVQSMNSGDLPPLTGSSRVV